VRLMKMVHADAGIRNDVIIGFPDGCDPLRELVIGPAAVWSRGDNHDAQRRYQWYPSKCGMQQTPRILFTSFHRDHPALLLIL